MARKQGRQALTHFRPAQATFHSSIPHSITATQHLHQLPLVPRADSSSQQGPNITDPGHKWVRFNVSMKGPSSEDINFQQCPGKEATEGGDRFP